ncbi:MAG: ZIP family metal transporter [Candidatus Lloydbacteria bacterium]|nr:ZIP family metal transporter [Candidatus Lloydbacteria bacterium]
MIIFIGVAAFLATFLGGIFALHLKDRLHLVLGFSAGAIIGVAFFELIPEAIEIASAAYPVSSITALMAGGFVLYLLLDRFILLHSHQNEDGAGHRGSVGAGSLSLHSFLDGMGIGLAFKVSPELGLVVTAAVLTHDFSDGINTVGLIIKNGGTRARALRWLAIDALAPVLGIVSTFFFSVSEQTLGLLLALFSGFFLYIGASDLLPESHHAHPVRWTTLSTILGIGVMYSVIAIVGV